jgi:hypothetical protein
MGEGQPLPAIAKEMGFTVRHVRRIIEKALAEVTT